MKKENCISHQNIFFPLGKEELININGGGKIANAFWYVVGYWVSQQKRLADSPTGKLLPSM